MKFYVARIALLFCLLLAACGTPPQSGLVAPPTLGSLPQTDNAATLEPSPTVGGTSNPANNTPTVRGTSSPANTPTSAPGNIYLALGDSVTYGLGASLPGRTNFAGVFYSYLRQLPQTTRFVNLALSGETSQTFIGNNTDGANSQLGRALAQIDAAKGAGLTIGAVTLMIGANDLLNTRGQSADQRDAALVVYQRNLNTILDRVTQRLAGQPTANLILLTYYNPYGGDPNSANSEAYWSERLNSVIRTAAKARALRLAEIYPLFVAQPDTLTWITYNDVHPTDAGHTLIARELWRASGYDTTAPALQLSFPPNATTLKVGGTNSTRIGLKVAVSDNVSQPPPSVRLLVDGKEARALDAIGNAYTTILDASGLAPGTHSVRVVATDAAGNVGTLDLPLTVE